MTDKIWSELVDIKYGEIYLTKYLSLQRTLKKAFNIMTLVISLSGILGWKYFEDYVWIVLILIAIMQLLTLVENQLIRSDKEVEEISALRMMYTRYFHKLEPLWNKVQYNILTDDEAIDKFFRLRKSDWEKIEELDCKLNIKRYKQLISKADKETRSYLTKYHKS